LRQRLGGQFQAFPAQLPGRGVQLRGRVGECLDVARARGKGAFDRLACAGQGEQALVQGRQSQPAVRRHASASSPNPGSIGSRSALLCSHSTLRDPDDLGRHGRRPASGVARIQHHQGQVGALQLGAGAADAFGLDRIEGLAQAGGIDQGQFDPVDADRLAVAGRGWSRGVRSRSPARCRPAR
jgi:hypothetical protein